MIFEFDLRDTNGAPVELGDLVRVLLPEVRRDALDEWGDDYYLPGRTAVGIIGLRLSRGLVVKITALISNDDGSEGDGGLVGKTIPLRRTARQWYKVNQQEITG